MNYPTLGDIIESSKSQDILGIDDRAVIIDYIKRGLDLAQWKANWNSLIGDMDICSDEHGCVTLPSEVDVILACNVGGFPSYFRNSWFQYHINGPGSIMNRTDGPVGPITNYSWNDKEYSPVIQDLKDWSYVCAFVEDPIDGNGSLSMQVFGETMDQQYNVKEAITIPVVGPSTPGVTIPLLNGFASTDHGVTQFRRITRVIKPITRGYVKLIAFTGVNGASGRTIGYYAPNETQPTYRRIRVSSPCNWVRIKYRRKEVTLVNDTDIIPIPSKQAVIYLLKAVRLADTNNVDLSEYYQNKAIEILGDIQLITDGPAVFHLQVDPSYGVGTIDMR